MTIDVSEVKRRLQALLNDQSLVDEYLRQFGPSSGNQNAKSALAPRREEEDPIYEIKLTCPVCSKKGIVSYELKSKSQTIVLNKFLVPIYTGRRSRPLTTLSCPRCLPPMPFCVTARTLAGSESDQTKNQYRNVITNLQKYQ